MKNKALDLADKTAEMIQTLRRTSMPLSDVIPHLQAQADELRRLHEAYESLRNDYSDILETLEELSAAATIREIK